MLPRRRLTFHALCVIEEAIRQAQRGKVAPSPALRLAIGFLRSVADTRSEYFHEGQYAEFWVAATMRAEADGSAAAFGRSQALTAAANGMAGAAGMPRDHAYNATMRRLMARA
jgi:hypothetical protein